MLLRPSDSSGKGPNSSKGSILVRTHTFVTIQLVRELTSKGKERAKQRGSALGAPSQPVNSPLKFLSPSSPRLFAFDYQSIIINQENPSIIPLIQSPKHPIFKPSNLFPSPRHPKIEPSKMPMPMPTPSPPCFAPTNAAELHTLCGDERIQTPKGTKAGVLKHTLETTHTADIAQSRRTAASDADCPRS